MPDFDERDAVIVAERLERLDAVQGPRVGDWVRFADNTERRISYHWRDDEGWDGGVQTTDGAGSFHLCEGGFCSYSGALHPCIPTASLRDTGTQKDGAVWIFHHDHWRAHNGVHTRVPFRVYETDKEPNR